MQGEFVIEGTKPYCRHYYITTSPNGTKYTYVDDVIELNYIDFGLWSCPECHRVYHKEGLFT
jgi:hypothetical protein